MWGTSTGKSRLRPAQEFLGFLILGVLMVTLVGCPPVPPGGEGEGEGEGEPPTFAPGLALVVEEVVIPADLRPEVIFRLEDEDGNPVPLSELTDIRFMLAYLADVADVGTDRFLSYTTRTENPDGVPNSGDEALQATYDGARLNGVSANGDGTYTYKFATAVPATYDRAATHQVGGQVVREYFVNGEHYVDNPIFSFVPNGSPVTQIREIALTETCNVCHTKLTAHGERHEMQLCILCHNTQSSDAQSGNTVDMPTMIHKIHMGANLPSVQQGDPYFIVGFQNSVHDYSEVNYPQPIQNCTSCHDDAAAQAEFYMTMPTMAGCVSCHDRTWFGSPATTPAGFTNHIIPQANDSLCADCHTPEAIQDHHLLPTQTAQAVGLDLAITDVRTAAVEAGLLVTIDFTAVDGSDMPYETLASLNSVSANVAWPAYDFQDYRREAVAPTPGGTLVNNGGGSYTYTFSRAIPADMETYGVAMEGRLRFTLDGATITQGLEDPSVTYFTADGAIVPEMARRAVVSDEQCAACHGGTIRAHGEQRIGVEYCVFCHNPNETDEARRPADAMPPVTVNFKEMIHKIHRGHDLVGEYTVYGFGNVPHDFTHIGFPGDESKCTMCHLPSTYDVPVPPEAVPTLVAQGDMIASETLPESAACTSCHDSAMAALHAALNSSFGTGVESCSVCHGSGAAFSVDLVHGLLD